MKATLLLTGGLTLLSILADCQDLYVFYENDNVVLQKGSVKTGLTKNRSRKFPVPTPDGASFTVTLNDSLLNEPCVFNTVANMLVLSDIEGEYENFLEIMRRYKVLDQKLDWSFERNHVVIVGDHFDRGEGVVPYLWLLYRMEQQAKKAGGYVHVILGNHDIMNLSGDLRYVQPKYFEAAESMGRNYMELFSKDTELGRWLRAKNIIEKINDRLFVHGGISPEVNERRWSIEQINTMCRKYYDDPAGQKNEEVKVFFDGKTSPFWYRGYFQAPVVSEAEVDSTMQSFDVKQIVVGHSIVPNIQTLYKGKVLGVDVNHHEGKEEAIFISAKEGFDPKYKRLRSRNIIVDKNFYLITGVNHSKKVKQLLPAAVSNGSRVEDFRFSNEMVDTLIKQLSVVYDSNTVVVDELTNQHIRPSGNYALYHYYTNKELWLKAWEDYFTGINYIIDQYGLGKKMRYPNIDSASYDATGMRFEEKGKLFYEAPLKVAMQLMHLNYRDEAARHEPLEKEENKAAIKYLRRVNFDEYNYSALVVPGDGPRSSDIRLAPASIERCYLAAKQFKNKLAPCIILTGGYCHPFQTPFSEAIEMKIFLMDSLGVAPNAIIIDPHARHTTTNFRNAGRYIIRYGLPIDKPALMVTSAGHADYIMDAKFDERNTGELRYLPYRDKRRVGPNAISFYPVVESLHRDPTDPLDP